MTRDCLIMLRAAAVLATATWHTPASLGGEAGLVPVGGRPTGALSGKIVYVHGGHGYTAANEGAGAWTTQRPLLLGMVEDLGNKDQMDLFVDELFRAGATIVPLRPVGHQPREFVLDNPDPAVTFQGDWNDSRAEAGFGLGPDPAYRFAETSLTESATARYAPRITTPGVYPVYAWAASGENRAADQLYRIHHSGGATEVTVNHRRVGDGLVYLGSYHFPAGRGAAVEISNRSADPGRVVVADMIRFGNGRGQVNRGGGISGLGRADEAGLYWVMWHAELARNVSTDRYRAGSIDRQATVSLAPRYARFMNREADGVLSDRVFVSFHSNAGAGKARGVLGLFNGNNYARSRTPNQLLLAETLARAINSDLIARPGRFEHEWHDRGDDLTLDRPDIEFGELNNKYIDDEFDATIIETGFHDNHKDAEMLRDPRVRMAIARASCRGLIEYFHHVDGGATPRVAPAQPVTHVTARGAGAGVVTLRWRPSANALGYVVTTSVDGRGFDSGRSVPGGDTTATTIAGLEPDRVYSFRVASRNRCGVSEPSGVVACVAAASTRRLLVVDGFDRLDRWSNAKQPYREGGVVERVWPRWNNPRDHAAVLATAIAASAPGTSVDSASNEAIIDGTVDLDAYDAVLWSLGLESRADATFDPSEQARVRAYVSQGGKLFVSGSELAKDLDRRGPGRSFCRDVLRLGYVSDDAGTHSAAGVADSLFAGIRLSFSAGEKGYSVDAPDMVRPVNGAKAVITYSDGAAVAGVASANGERRVVALGFPLEAVTDDATRTEMVGRVLRFFGVLSRGEGRAVHTPPTTPGGSST